MKKIAVYEQVKTRIEDWYTGFGDWKDFDGTFEECCQSIENKYKNNNNRVYDVRIQVAKFYYDENGQYIAWNTGKVFNTDNWEPEH